MELIIKGDCYADYLTISSSQSEGPTGPAEKNLPCHPCLFGEGLKNKIVMNFHGGVSSNIATFGVGKEGNLSTTAKDVCFFSLPISCVLFSFFCQVYIALSL